jgi:hypothetical protein
MSTALQADDCTELLTPCPCTVCKRYGKTGVASNDRPVMCNGAWVVEVAGRCTRCHYPLDGPAYMVFDGAESINGRCLGWRASPVCGVCVTIKERQAPHREEDCGGCGRLLYFPSTRIRRKASLNGDQRQLATTCNNACFRRALRKKRRLKGHVCTTCREEFASARKDAKFCSGACRQWTYRMRGAQS